MAPASLPPSTRLVTAMGLQELATPDQPWRRNAEDHRGMMLLTNLCNRLFTRASTRRPIPKLQAFAFPTVAAPAHQTHAFARARQTITLDDAEGPFPAPQPWVEVGLTPCLQLLPGSPPLWVAGSPTTTRVSLFSPHEPDERTTGTRFHPNMIVGTRTPFHGPLVKADRFPKPGVPSINRSRFASSGSRPKLASRAATGALV
jgi:hypothetical protein